MTTPLENLFPLASNLPGAPDLRSYLASAIIAVFDDPDLSAEDFSIQPYPAIAIRGDDGELTLYAYDATDTTTADDGGVTCIVVSGRRYIRTTELIVQDSALSATTTAQPASPALGDTYVVPAAPSGDDWSTEAKTVATWTARGWVFRQPWTGMIVYVEDEATYYHYTAAGSWASGLPLGAIADGTITPMKLAHPFAILRVVDERNAPPGSPPSTGTMYQVGTSPTGDFASNTKEIARYNGTSYDFIAPEEGDTIYRLDEGVLYTYRSGVWGTTAPAQSVLASYYDEHTVSSTPSPGFQNLISFGPITGAIGQKVRVKIHMYGGSTAGSGLDIGVRKDTEGSLSKSLFVLRAGTHDGASGIAEIDVPDASPHTYHVSTTIGTNYFDVIPVYFRATLELIIPGT